MKLSTLVIAQEALQRLLALEISAATAFKVARAVRPLQMELQTYEQRRVALVQRFGEDTGQGQTMVLPEKAAEFNEEMNSLLDVDIELSLIALNPNIFGEVKVKPADLLALWFLFEEEA